MRKYAFAALAAAVLAAPTASFANELFFDKLEAEKRKMLGTSTLALMKDARKMGVKLDKMTVPGFVIEMADDDKDGVISDAEFTRAETRIREMIGG